MALPFNIADLASLASLEGTLSSPEGILTLSQAVNQRMADEARQRTTAATQEASQAGQAYGQAAAAPVQTPDSLATMLPLLTGNIASVIAQDPNFAKRGSDEVTQRRQDLVKSRADNLIALKDNYDKKALLAAHLQDNETELEMRQKSEQLSKTLDVLMQEQRLTAAAGEAEKNRQTDLKIAGIRAQNTARDNVPYTQEDIQASVDDLAEGRTEITNVPTAHGFRAAVQTELRAQGKRIMPGSVRKALNELSSATAVIKEIKNISKSVNTAKPNLLSRVAQGAKNTAEAINQSGLAADLDQVRGGFAGNLSRAVAAERGVLTDQDRAYAMRLVPSLYTAKDVAERKLNRLERFLIAKKNAAILSYTFAGGGTVGKVKVRRVKDDLTGTVDTDDPGLKTGEYEVIGASE